MKRLLRLTIHSLFIVGTMMIIISSVGCVANSALLDTTVNDPVMLDLKDLDNDFFSVEDGGGSSGSSMSCYS